MEICSWQGGRSEGNLEALPETWDRGASQESTGVTLAALGIFREQITDRHPVMKVTEGGGGGLRRSCISLTEKRRRN